MAYYPKPGEEIKAAQRWNDNSEMIEDVAKLHLDRDMRSVDVTYGEGVWWRIWKPKRLVKHDKFKLDGVDFTALPHRARSFDMWAFDPEYVAQGGRVTSRNPLNPRFGMLTAPKTPQLLREQIKGGIAEGYRILRPGGVGLFKCMNYVSSGTLQPGVQWGIDDSEEIGFEVFDIAYFVGHVRPQPRLRLQYVRDENGKVVKGEDGKPFKALLPVQQVHLRTNVSMLLVLRK